MGVATVPLVCTSTRSRISALLAVGFKWSRYSIAAHLARLFSIRSSGSASTPRPVIVRVNKSTCLQHTTAPSNRPADISHAHQPSLVCPRYDPLDMGAPGDLRVSSRLWIRRFMARALCLITLHAAYRLQAEAHLNWLLAVTSSRNYRAGFQPAGSDEGRFPRYTHVNRYNVGGRRHNTGKRDNKYETTCVSR